MDKVINLYKPLGISPLDAVELFRKSNPQYADVKIGYAGRLDPMAEGLLLLLVGDENKNREGYLGLDKEYNVECILGMETDSYDVLGLVEEGDVKAAIRVSKEDVKNALQKFEGDIEQKYPPYSSMTVDGKPLFWWAREGRLDEIEIPSAKRHIEKIKLTSFEKVSMAVLQENIFEKISHVQGNFRQDEIIKKWNEFFSKERSDVTESETFMKISLTVRCSSGTYMRTLIHDLGTILGTKATTFSITRTKVGEYEVEDSIMLPSQQHS